MSGTIFACSVQIVLMQQICLFVKARYRLFLIAFIYVESLHSTRKKEKYSAQFFIYLKILTERWRALVSDFRYLAPTSVYIKQKKWVISIMTCFLKQGHKGFIFLFS